MDSELVAFLDGRTPFSQELATWGPLELEIHYYSSLDAPPDHLITSCRAVVLDAEHVLVIRDPSGEEHIIPGGRRKPGEPLEDTLHREVFEETCWTVADLSVLAVVHFHIASARPEGYLYPYPDFAQVVFLARPLEFHAGQAIQDEWVVRCEMVSLDSVGQRPIPESERRILARALRRRGVGWPGDPNSRNGEAV